MGPSVWGGAVQGTWELVAAPAVVVVGSPELAPGETMTTSPLPSRLPAAAAVCGSATRFPGRPGERVGLYRDIYDSVITTPSRPASRRLIRVDELAVKSLHARFRGPTWAQVDGHD